MSTSALMISEDSKDFLSFPSLRESVERIIKPMFRHRFFWTIDEMGKPLTRQELHNLAMNIVGRELEADGYEFMGVNSKLKKNPQFVCLKDKQLHFIIVRPVNYPDNPEHYDWALMENMKAHAKDQEARLCYAGVGLYNAADRFLPVYLDEDYMVDYDGLIEITDE